MRLGRAFAGLALAIVAASCSLSLDGFSTGVDADGGTGGDGAAPPNAPPGTPPANVPPGQPPPVPPGAPPPPGDDGGTTFCATHTSATFCEDFDQGALGAKWDDTTEMNNGTLTLSTTDAPPSPPNALFAVSATNLAGSNRTIFAKKLPSASAITVELDIKLAQVGAATTRTSFVMVGLGTHAIGIGMHPNSTDYVEFANSTTTMANAGSAPAVGTWTHFKLDVVLGAAPSATITNGGTAATPMTLDPSFVAGASNLQIGLVFVESTATAWQYRVDNVIATVTP